MREDDSIPDQEFPYDGDDAANEEIESEEGTRGCIRVSHVAKLLERVRSHQFMIECELRELRQWLDGSAGLREFWDAFEQAGGITAEDFRRFAEGTFRPRQVRQKQHLRLIGGRKLVVRRPRSTYRGGDAA